MTKEDILSAARVRIMLFAKCVRDHPNQENRFLERTVAVVGGLSIS